MINVSTKKIVSSFLISLLALPLILFAISSAITLGMAFLVWGWPEESWWWFMLRLSCIVSWVISVLVFLKVLSEKLYNDK